MQTLQAAKKTENRTKQNKPSFSIVQILQFVIMAALLAFILIMLFSGSSKEVEMSYIAQQMEADASVKALTKKEPGDAAKTFSVDVTTIGDSLYYRIDDVMDVRELFIVRIEDDNNRQTVIDQVEKYLKEKTDSFDGYGTDQFGLLSAAVTTEKGDYYFFGVSEDVVQWESEFLESIK